ncbi:MAG: FAD-dependent oxidoreductase [Candidatus Nealsonbacteria bacterium]|nr:FAD-dependent oxidoreductase [Candidatus Nealsonbacteria bacterium]
MHNKIAQKKIVILGAGFAGLRCAKILEGFYPGQVTLIDKNNHHLYTPELYELKEKRVKLPITAKAEFLQKEVADWRRLDYDYLVLAVGAQTNYYNIPGLKDNALTFKNLEDIERIRKISAGDISIIGGGVTGVELAAQLAIKLEGERIKLIEGSPCILSNLEESFKIKVERRLKKLGIDILCDYRLNKVEPGRIFFENGEILKFDNLIWTGGVKMGEYKVDKYLRADGEKNVFAVGDCASVNPGMIRPALEQAEIAAMNIKNSIEGKPLVIYQPKFRGIFIPLGGYSAAVKIGKMKMLGFLPWLIKELVNFLYKKTYGV